MSWLKKLFGGKKEEKHDDHQNCEGGVCEPKKEAQPEQPSEPQAPEQGSGEQTM